MTATSINQPPQVGNLMQTQNLLRATIAIHKSRCNAIGKMLQVSKPIYLDIVYHAGNLSDQLSIKSIQLAALPDELKVKLADILEWIYCYEASEKLRYEQQLDEVGDDLLKAAFLNR